jgi:outer membrane protein OmpA-like peptidoglycan-associated protein
MTIRHTLGLFVASAALVFSTVGCATKKHVREAIAPVQNQVNQTQSQLNQTQGQVTSLQKQTDEQKQAIGDLDRQVATADEKATDAAKKAAEAAEAAAKANAVATEATQRADAANNTAQQAQQNVTRIEQNITNYKLMTTEQVFFAFNQSALSKAERAKLDDTAQKITALKNYVVEVAGYADRSGDKNYNRELSRKRADAVVHYLAVEHSIPLRSIRELGVGSDFPDADNKTAAARKENRRVDVRIYTLDLGGRESADLR